MAEDRFDNFDDPRVERNRLDPRLYTDDRDFGRSNASVGWIVGAVVLLGILIYAFGWQADERTASNSPPPITTGQASPPSARPAPTPGPIGTATAPSVTPQAPSTTGSGSSGQ